MEEEAEKKLGHSDKEITEGKRHWSFYISE
jgi:hypothetical protein